MKRSEQRINDTWDLSSLCKDRDEFTSRVKSILSRVEELRAYNSHLGESSDILYEALTKIKEFNIEIECLSNYAFLKFESDASCSENAQDAGVASNLGARLMQEISYFEPEILSLEPEILDKYLSEDRFSEYRVYIKKLLHMKEHTLSKKEEHLLSLNAEARSACSKTFHDLTDIDLEFGTINGEKLTQSSFMSFIRDDDESIRREAYEKFYSAFEKHQHTIARLYEGSINQDIFISRARGYKSSLEAALYPDNVDESVYRNLISTVHKGFPTLHRYYELMAKVLKKDKLKHYDVYVPLVKSKKSNHTYDEAVKIIEKAVEPLGKEYQETLIKGLTTERWVDRYENDGKRSGAFSSGAYTGKPYILINYKEDVISSMFTLIHEGGHSMHSYYSVRNNPFMSYDYTIFEAEVASTFNEQLLATYLLNNTEDKETRAYLISSRLSGIVGTLFRQTMFAEYELLCHEAVERGEVATISFLRSTYRKLLEEYFGPILEFEANSDLEGLRIPHFYRAFYVYKYATGICASIALANKVLTGNDEDREAYLGFLKSGGSQFPIDSLKKGGVNMAESDPIESAIRYFDSLVTELEGLI